MELPLKYMVLNPNLQTDNYIFEMKLIPMTTELVLVLNVYLLKTKISPGLIQSIQANDSNLDFFNKLVNLSNLYLILFKSSEFLVQNSCKFISISKNSSNKFKSLLIELIYSSL